MANTILTPEVIAKQALASLTETTVMKHLIHTDLTAEFKAAKVGDTINVRKPAVFTSKKFDRARGIEIQDATEGSIPVVVDQFDDVSFTVTSEELALNIEKFDEQLITPAMQAITTGVDRYLLSLGAGATAQAGTTDPFLIKDPNTLIDAGRILDTNLVPQDDRYAVIDPTLKAHWINTPILKQVDQSGSTEGLYRASLGQELYGFTPYFSNNFAPNPEAGTTGQGLAFHKSAFAFAAAALEVPAGAHGYVATEDGLSVRCVMQYDISKKATTVSLDILYGAKLLDPKRVVRLTGAAA